MRSREKFSRRESLSLSKLWDGKRWFKGLADDPGETSRVDESFGVWSDIFSIRRRFGAL